MGPRAGAIGPISIIEIINNMSNNTTSTILQPDHNDAAVDAAAYAAAAVAADVSEGPPCQYPFVAFLQQQCPLQQQQRHLYKQ